MIIPRCTTIKYYQDQPVLVVITCEGCGTLLASYDPGVPGRPPTPHTAVDCLQALRASITALQDMLDTRETDS